MCSALPSLPLPAGPTGCCKLGTDALGHSGGLVPKGAGRGYGLLSGVVPSSVSFPTFPEMQFYSVGASGQLGGQDKGGDLPKVTQASSYALFRKSCALFDDNAVDLKPASSFAEVCFLARL